MTEHEKQMEIDAKLLEDLEFGRCYFERCNEDDWAELVNAIFDRLASINAKAEPRTAAILLYARLGILLATSSYEFTQTDNTNDVPSMN